MARLVAHGPPAPWLQGAEEVEGSETEMILKYSNASFVMPSTGSKIEMLISVGENVIP